MTTSREQRWEQRRKSERGRRGRGWEQRAFVARSRICRTLCRVKTREKGVVSVGRWANRYLHSTYDDVNAEKKGPRGRACAATVPTKAFRLQGDSFLSRSLSRTFLKDEDETERERETPRFDVRLVVANAISVLLSSRWWEHASPTVVERTCTRCVRGQKERQTFLFHAFPSPVTNIQCHSQQMFLWKTIRESLVTCRDRKASQKAGPTATARTWPDKTRRTDADIGVSRCRSFENNFRARITTHGIGSGRIEIPWNKFCANRVTRGIIVSRYIS